MLKEAFKEDSATRAKTAPFPTELAYLNIPLFCFVCAFLFAPFFPTAKDGLFSRGPFLLKEAYKGDIVNANTALFLTC